MINNASSLASPAVHLVGPGKIKVLNRRLAYCTGQGAPVRLDPHRLQLLICYGPVGISDDAFQMLFRCGVQVAWLSPHGNRLRGRLVALDDSALLLRRCQHQVADNATLRLQLARQVVGEKIQSQLDAARHYQRHAVAGAKTFLR